MLACRLVDMVMYWTDSECSVLVSWVYRIGTRCVHFNIFLRDRYIVFAVLGFFKLPVFWKSCIYFVALVRCMRGSLEMWLWVGIQSTVLDMSQINEVCSITRLSASSAWYEHLFDLVRWVWIYWYLIESAVFGVFMCGGFKCYMAGICRRR